MVPRKPGAIKSTFIPQAKKLVIFCVISIGIYLVNVHNCGTTFLEASTKVDASQINAFYFFDVWFSPTAALVLTCSESVLLSRCICSFDINIEAEKKSITPFDMSSNLN